jgi:hypothetical protein
MSTQLNEDRATKGGVPTCATVSLPPFQRRWAADLPIRCGSNTGLYVWDLRSRALVAKLQDTIGCVMPPFVVAGGGSFWVLRSLWCH